MKTFLLIIGIIVIVAGVLSLLFAALNMFGYRHVLDGSAELYKRMHERMIVFTVTGIVLALIGTACLIIRFKI